MKKPVVIKACRYWREREGEGPWDVVLYWDYDPDDYPHDWNLSLTPKEWRKLSKLRSPKPDEVMNVQVTMEILE
ncbi:MAG: hypothetical protein GWN86_21060 [Desulfobacterales bacterium]|nr:hypothetical protein [Desulfobacterales bacterium]